MVTGATSGIGLACVQALLGQGANVIGVGRSAERCQVLEQRLRGDYPGAKLRFCLADLALQSQVRALQPAVRGVLQEWGITCLDGLVNNAGVFTLSKALTPEGIDTQWAVNHLAPFLLTHLLLDWLRAAPAARVVTVSSDSHYGGRLDLNDPQTLRGYNGLRAYQNSKLANVLFTLELNRRLADSPNVRAFAADPGLVKTEMGFKGTPRLVRWFWAVRRRGGTDVGVPVRGILYLLGEPSIQASPHVYWMDCAPKQPSRRALDAQAAARLWVISEAMCAISTGGSA